MIFLIGIEEVGSLICRNEKHCGLVTTRKQAGMGEVRNKHWKIIGLKIEKQRRRRMWGKK